MSDEIEHDKPDAITRLRAENERLLAANRDVMLHWDVLKADYDKLRAALRSVMDDLTLIEKNHWLPVGMLDDVIYVNARAALEGPQDRMAKPLEGK